MTVTTSTAPIELPAHVGIYGGTPAQDGAIAVREASEPLPWAKAEWATAFVAGGGLDLPRAARLATLDIAMCADKRHGVANWATTSLQSRFALSYTTVKRGLRDAVNAGWISEALHLSPSRNIWQLAMGDTSVMSGRLLASMGGGVGGRPRKLDAELRMLAHLGVSETLRDEWRPLGQSAELRELAGLSVAEALEKARSEFRPTYY